MQTCSSGQFFLRDPELIPVESDRSAKLFLHVRFSHKPLDFTR